MFWDVFSWISPNLVHERIEKQNKFLKSGFIEAKVRSIVEFLERNTCKCSVKKNNIIEIEVDLVR